MDSLRSEADGAWPPPVEDEEDHSLWDPPRNLLEMEYQFPNSTAEEILDRLFHQVRDLLEHTEVSL